MIDQQLIAEQLGKPFRDLGGNGDLGQQVQNLAAHLQHLVDQAHVDFRLPARSNAM